MDPVHDNHARGGAARIDALIQEVAADLGYLVYESGVLYRGVNSRISVKIDHADTISHSDCERYSRELARRIDGESLLPNYSLEVSSPGLNRKIRGIQEFLRFTGNPAKVIYIKDGMKLVAKGTIVSVEGEAITMETETGIEVIEVSQVERANLDY